MNNLITKFKKLTLLLATSCLLIVASESATLMQATPSAELSATPSSSTQSSQQEANVQEIQEIIVKEKLPLSEQSLFEAETKQRKLDPSGKFAVGLIGVRFKPSATESARIKTIEKHNGKISKIMKGTGTKIIKVKEGEEKKILEELRTNPDVEYADLIGVAKIQGWGAGGGGLNIGWTFGTGAGCNPNDEYFCIDYQWNLKQIGAVTGWGFNRGSSSTIIAVLDTGINYNHPDLDAKIWKNPGESGNGKENNGNDDDGNGYVDDYMGWDFVGNGLTPDKDPMDAGGHGTFVAGIAAAETDNYTGIAGVSWNAKIMNLRTDTPSVFGGGTFYDTATDAVRYAVDNGAKVINMSFSGPNNYFASEFNYAIQYARANNVEVVAAVAYPPNVDDHNCFIGLPAGFANVISVSAYDKDANKVAACTNLTDNNGTFQKLQTSGPGQNIFSTDSDGYVIGHDYGGKPHTSWSTPAVAAVVSMLYECTGGNHNRIMNALKWSGNDYGTPGWDNLFGYRAAHLWMNLDYDCY